MCVATTVASCLAATSQVVGIAEAGDVVADDRARRARGVEHRRAPGVDRQRHVEAGAQRLDRGDDAVELLVLADLGTGPGLHAADVEQVGAVGDELLGPAHERVERPRRAPVVERIGRAVQDAHHDDARRGCRSTRSPRRSVGNGATDGHGAQATDAHRRDRPRRRPSAPRGVELERDRRARRARPW